MSRQPLAQLDSRLVLYVNWDGFAYEWYRLVNTSYGGTPHINALLQDGVLFTNASTGVPAITGAMQQCLASGAWPVDTGNCYRYYDAENNVVMQFARENRLENIAEAAVRHKVSVAGVNAWYFENRGLFEGKEQQPYLKTESMPSNFGQRVDELIKIIHGEPVRIGDKHIIFDGIPQFLSIYADDIDTVAHNGRVTYDGLKVAGDIQEWYDNIAQTIMRMDQDLGRLVAALRRTGRYEHSSIVLTTDHGMIHYGAHSKEQLNEAEPGGLTSLYDMTACIANVGLRHIGRKFTIEILPAGGMQAKSDTDIVIVPIMLQAQITFLHPACHPAIPDIIEQIKSKVYYGTHLTHDELMKAGLPSAYADLLISSCPPYHFIPDPHGYYAVGGNHASLDPQVKHIFTMLSGANIAKGVVCDKPISIIDIAPTLARLLGFEGPQHATGTALDDGLQNHMQGPQLTITTTEDTIYTTEATVSGKASSGATITINGEHKGDVDESGSFAYTINCAAGVNRVLIEAAHGGRISRRTIYMTVKDAIDTQ